MQRFVNGWLVHKTYFLNIYLSLSYKVYSIYCYRPAAIFSHPTSTVQLQLQAPPVCSGFTYIAEITEQVGTGW